ncbi:hypothetical protein JCGZ_22766 [Jatropha curcas]|uniref:Vesicle-fusing ATPase n=1 Tax=Jatropha curcas TaxID=180498 RepID=A0A067LGF1_JATCU|nr:hypothetical protein JCGZ_22766 [Jatropha curcas]
MESKMLVTPVQSSKRFTNKAYMSRNYLNLFQSEKNPSPSCFSFGSPKFYGRINGLLVLSLCEDSSLMENQIALNEEQCAFAKTEIGNELTVERFEVNGNAEKIEELDVDLDILNYPEGKMVNAKHLVKELKKSFCGQMMHEDQTVQFRYGKFSGTFKVNRIILASNGARTSQGMLHKMTKVLFLSENIRFFNQAVLTRRIFLRSMNLSEVERELMTLGLGGMSKIFRKIYERVLTTRTLDLELCQKLNQSHVKGILLFGPPGNGKTLLAKTIAKILYAKEFEVVDGPQVLSSWFGGTEARLRALFDKAREDNTRYGEQSGLHIIIFDELDSIARKRGITPGETATDRIVSQLLTMINGVEDLNNILIIGTTNKKELIDEALLRPGRLLPIEVGLPDEEARLNILRVHTEPYERRGYFQDVDLREIANMTDAFSGADLAGVVNTAFSDALGRTNSNDGIIHESQTRIYQNDFIHGVREICRANQPTEDEDWDALV